MCGPSDENKSGGGCPKPLTIFLGASTVGLLVATIVLAVQKNDLEQQNAAQIKNLEKQNAEQQKQLDDQKAAMDAAADPADPTGNFADEIAAMKAKAESLRAELEQCATEVVCPAAKVDYGLNPCEGMRPDWANAACITEGEALGPQSGSNVTKGYKGNLEEDVVPITTPYRDNGLCPVNVHWHLGTEHYSMGEFDENGSGPIEFHEGRIGFQCSYYDENDPKFTTPYDWQHCIGMTIGQTYEIHWPHSAAGACNSPWQYQTPFYDGVFCNLDAETLKGVTRQDVANAVGVQSQTFTVVNDEAYYYPDLFSGMIVDQKAGAGVDLAIYTGSTTGTARNNDVCSPFNPITWQVDRKCHLISASSFDKMCAQMESQADNLKDDLYAHGSRMLVSDDWVADNHQQRKRKGRAL